MKNNPGGRSTAARRVALGGIFSALALLILLAGGLIPIGTFAAPIFAGFCLLPLAIDINTKTALVCYAAVSILAALIVPDKELVLFFIFLLGYYPLLHPHLYKIKSKVLRFICKFLLFNISVALVYILLLFVFVTPALHDELAGYAPYFFLLLLTIGNVTFLCYDSLIDRVKWFYCQRIRKQFFH